MSDKENLTFGDEGMQLTFDPAVSPVFEDLNVSSRSNVVQSNYIIEHKPKMTEDEQKMFLTLVATINKDDEDFKPLKLRVTDIISLWGLPQKSAYRRVKKSLSGLLDKKFELERIRSNGTRYTEKTSYISYYAYGEGDGYATIRIDPMFKPYLIGLKNDPYTLFVLGNALRLKGATTIRTFELLAQYAVLGQRVFTVKDYKKKVGIEDKYKGSNANLKKNVLDKVVKQISEKTQLLTRYDLTGRGENALITFVIYRKEKLGGGGPARTDFGTEEKDILLQLLKDETDIGLTFTDDIINQAIEMAVKGAKNEKEMLGKYNVLKTAYEAFEARMLTDDIKHPWPYFKKILENKLT